MSARKTARGVVLNDGAILLMERWRETPSGKKLHYFSIPGGGVEKGETPEIAVVRELFEEMNIVVRPQQKIGTTPRTDGGTHSYFLCEYLSGEPELQPDSEEAQRASATNKFKPLWVSAEDFATVPLHPEYEPMRKKILDILGGAGGLDERALQL